MTTQALTECHLHPVALKSEWNNPLSPALRPQKKPECAPLQQVKYLIPPRHSEQSLLWRSEQVERSATNTALRCCTGRWVAPVEVSLHREASADCAGALNASNIKAENMKPLPVRDFVTPLILLIRMTQYPLFFVI